MYWVAGVFAVLLAGCAGRYGYHRDEMYFLAAGRRLDWGYADQPPLVPLPARAMAAIDADSLVVLRLPAIAAATAVIVCTGWAARELGGGRAAQTLAAAAAASSAFTADSGEAAAIERFGAPYGLPVPRSGHHVYWWWGPPADSRPVLTVGLTRAEVARFCTDSAPEAAGRIDNGLGIDNDEQGAALYVCRTVRAPWAQLWPSQRQLG